MDFRRYDRNTSFIKAWKVLGALVRPKGMTKNLKWLWWERHNQELEVVVVGAKCCLLHVSRVHSDLMVP